MADPLDASYIPKPEWNFLFFYQALKFFPGRLEVIATVGIPLVGFPGSSPDSFRGPHPERRPTRRLIAMAGWVIAVVMFHRPHTGRGLQQARGSEAQQMTQTIATDRGRAGGYSGCEKAGRIYSYRRDALSATASAPPGGLSDPISPERDSRGVPASGCPNSSATRRPITFLGDAILRGAQPGSDRAARRLPAGLKEGAPATTPTESTPSATVPGQAPGAAVRRPAGERAVLSPSSAAPIMAPFSSRVPAPLPRTSRNGQGR